MKKREDGKEGISDAFLKLQNIQPSYMDNAQEGANQDKEEADFEREDDENVDEDEHDKGEAFEEGHDKKVKLKVNINVTNFKESKMTQERRTKTE